MERLASLIACQVHHRQENCQRTHLPQAERAFPSSSHRVTSLVPEQPEDILRTQLVICYLLVLSASDVLRQERLFLVQYNHFKRHQAVFKP